jgi:hypothetical protein
MCCATVGTSQPRKQRNTKSAVYKNFPSNHKDIVKFSIARSLTPTDVNLAHFACSQKTSLPGTSFKNEIKKATSTVQNHFCRVGVSNEWTSWRAVRNIIVCFLASRYKKQRSTMPDVEMVAIVRMLASQVIDGTYSV